MNPIGALVDIYVEKVVLNDGSWVPEGSHIALLRAVEYDAGSITVDLSGLESGSRYRAVVSKSSNELVGDVGPVFRYLP